MAADLPLGKFTCPVTFERVRPPKPRREEKDGITYSSKELRTCLPNRSAFCERR